MTRMAILLIRGYQRFISPVVPPACKYYPTCSQYACEALEKHGLMRGLGLAAARLARCVPWRRGGVDFVPRSSKGAS